MKPITKIRKADRDKKNKIWNDMDMTRMEAEELVCQMILSLPGCYKLHSRDYGTNLVDSVYESYGWMPSMFVSEQMVLGLASLHPKKVYASFTFGLDSIEIK